jgi:hypothetical protein
MQRARGFAISVERSSPGPALDALPKMLSALSSVHSVESH